MRLLLIALIGCSSSARPASPSAAPRAPAAAKAPQVPGPAEAPPASPPAAGLRVGIDRTPRDPNPLPLDEEIQRRYALRQRVTKICACIDITSGPLVEVTVRFDVVTAVRVNGVGVDTPCVREAITSEVAPLDLESLRGTPAKFPFNGDRVQPPLYNEACRASRR